MTPEDLERLVVVADDQGLADAVANLTEAERKKLSTTAQKLKRDLVKAEWDRNHRPKLSERLLQLLGKRQVNRWEQLRVADLALLAVGPLSQVKKVESLDRRAHGEPPPEAETTALRILRDRRPDWIDEWVEAMLAKEWMPIDWDTLWQLIKEGICEKPTSEDYYRVMAQSLSGWSRWQSKQNTQLSDLLASEPMWLEDAYKLFEVDTVAFVHDYYESKDLDTWPVAMMKLSERGLLDRDRLLDGTLSGQTTGFKQNILSGYARFHERLEPTPDEMAARQALYCDLISVRLNQVVSFAVKMIKKLDQAKQLNDEAFVQTASRVFDVTTKGPPKAIITILKKLVKRRPDLVPEASRAFVDALNHPAEDVQTAALSVLSGLSDRLDSNIVQEIADRLQDLPANVRPQALELIEKTGCDVDVDSDDAEAASDLEGRLLESRERAAKVEAHWRELAGVDDSLESIEQSWPGNPSRAVTSQRSDTLDTAVNHGGWPNPLEFDLMQVPVLSGLEPIEPIKSFEELIDAIAHGIEKVDEAIEVERILDGMSRLCDQRPDDFERRVAPLIKRIEKTRDSDSARGIASPHVGFRELSRLVGEWLAGQSDLAKPSWGGGSNPTRSVLDFVDERLAVLRQRIAKRKPAPLLSAPTHQRGWIAPAAIVDRWRETEQGDSRPPRHEIIQALLRMAPEGRSEALAGTDELTHRWARALRWALGAEDGPRKEDLEDADIWLAAGRARSPLGRLDVLADLGLIDTHEPDALAPARYSWQTNVREHKDYSNVTHRLWELAIDVEPSLTDKGQSRTRRPTVLLHCKPNSRWSPPYGTSTPWVYDWISMVWPGNLRAFFMTGTRAMVSRLDETGSSWEPNHVFMPPLFDVDRHWDDIAQLMIVFGVAGRDQDVRGLAIDALVEAIADGRVHPDTLGATLTTLTEPYLLKLNRLCENLAEVARVSPLHAWTVMGALTKLLEKYDELPRDVHYLLALLQELHAQLGLPLQEVACQKLQPVKGTSKTAKLSKALCAYAPEQPTTACMEARLLTLEARLDRAERWGGA